jgi:hypothetical protein
MQHIEKEKRRRWTGLYTLKNLQPREAAVAIPGIKAAPAKTGRLEDTFADWYCQKYKFDKFIRNETVTGESGHVYRGEGIHFVRHTNWQRYINKAAMLVLLASVTVFLLIGFEESAAILVLGTLGLWVGISNYKQMECHVWVKCIDQHEPVTKEQMLKFIIAAEDYKRNLVAEWYPDKLLLVTDSGYNWDALELARDREVVCFRRISKNFLKVS